MATAKQAQTALRAKSQPDRVASTQRFFKAYPGGYSEGDKFLACTVPVTRDVAKRFYGLPLAEIKVLLMSEWHDDRLLALIILVHQYRRADALGQQAIYRFYMAQIGRVNNWDLVDSSAPYIVGPYLRDRPDKMAVLQALAAAESLWERRIAMLATFDYIRQGSADETLAIAEQLLRDRHDLIQKAVGWMLREVGKRVDRQRLLDFLNVHAAAMPRTSLRYAIEHLDAEQRAYYRALKAVK